MTHCWAALPAQASVVMPSSFLSDQTAPPVNGSEIPSTRITQHAGDASMITLSRASSSPPLPLAGWLLGALFVALIVAEFRRDITRTT
ncbi:MAG: hypothetical protein AAF686_06170 [Pseudomonadota bacterium]